MIPNFTIDMTPTGIFLFDVFAFLIQYMSLKVKITDDRKFDHSCWQKWGQQAFFDTAQGMIKDYLYPF